MTDDLTGLLHLQGGQIDQIGAGNLPLIDNFNLGPTLVRGFARAAWARATSPIPTSLAGNGLGGTTYFGGSAELQFPIFGLPKEVGLKGAIFADAGTLFGFRGRRIISEPARLHDTAGLSGTETAPPSAYTQPAA